MGLNLRFMPYTEGDSDGVEIYRATSKNGERTLIKSLGAGIHEFSDHSVEANKVYWYWILNKSAANGDRLSQPMSAPTFIDMGPGSKKLLRGDWDFGYLGFVPVADMFTYAQVQAAAAIQVAPDTGTLKGFHKCVVNGRIIYIGDILYARSVNRTTAGKALLAQDSDVGTTAARLAVNDYEYIIRCPYSSTLSTTAVVGTGDGLDGTIKLSEVGMLASLILDTDTAGKLSGNKLGDLANNGVSTFYFSNTYAANNVVNVFSLVADASIGPASDMTGNRPFWPVFELVLHE
ncbi:hypothetical protein NFI00_000185 [Salmonella enterica]|nr:hypothetical protein [Salmonella enterica]